MTWQDPNSRWRRVQRRRIRLLALCSLWPLGVIVLGAAVLCIATLTTGGSLASLMKTDLPPSVVRIWLLVSGGSILALVLNIWSVRSDLRIERQVLDDVPAHDGGICTACRTVLPEAARLDPEATVACASCGVEQSLAKARSAWAVYHEQSIERGQAPLEVAPDDEDWEQVRVVDHPFLTLIVAFGFFSIYAATVAFFSGTSMIMSVLDYFRPVVLVGAGPFLILCGIRARTGTMPHCAKCLHPLPDASQADDCPECGARWRRPHGIIRGERRKRPGLILLGALVVAMSGLILTGVMSASAVSILPTGSLIKEVAAGREEVREWDELRTRTLTNRQAQRLLDRLLERQEYGRRLTADQEAWIAERLEGRSKDADPAGQ